MPQLSNLDLSKDMKNHPDISQLLRVIMTADPFMVVEGTDEKGRHYVIISGSDDHFKFTKSDTGYIVEKTK